MSVAMLEEPELEEDIFDSGEEDDSGPVKSVYVGSFLEDVKSIAREYMQRFFNGRQMHCGGKIQDRVLWSERNISLVLNTNIEQGVQIAYAAMEEAEYLPTLQVASDSFVADDIKFIIRILKQCAKMKIPKEFAAGIMLLFLEYCEGIDIEAGFNRKPKIVEELEDDEEGFGFDLG